MSNNDALPIVLVIGLVVFLIVYSLHVTSPKYGPVGPGSTNRDKLVREGTTDGVSFKVLSHEEYRTRGKRYVKVPITTITCEGGLPPELSIGRDAELSSKKDRDLAVGDPEFDRAVGLRGPRGLALALLDEPLRTRLRSAVSAGWRLADGIWRFAPSEVAEGQLEARLAEGVGLVRDLRLDPAELALRLLTRLRADTVLAVRLAALDELVQSHPAAPEVAEALDLAAADAEPALRLRAADERGDVAALDAFVDTAAPELAAQALDALVGHHGDDPRTAAALAEARLVALVEGPHEPLRLAAIRALGVRGSVAAVAPLLPLRERFLGGAAKDAARAAILAIQARAGDVEAGRLAVVAPNAGGALALTSEPEAAAEAHRDD